MKETWYGDKRDLLKWSAVSELSKRHDVTTVFYVAMITESAAHELLIDDEHVAVCASVWGHFRSLRNIDRLFKSRQLEAFTERFSHQNRGEYFDRALSKLRTLIGRKLVLIDPDTGITDKDGSESHVRSDECQTIWRALSTGDVLLIYQHAWRDPGWRQKAVKRLHAALKGARIFKMSASFARDVLLLGAVKS